MTLKEREDYCGGAKRPENVGYPPRARRIGCAHPEGGYSPGRLQSLSRVFVAAAVLILACSAALPALSSTISNIPTDHRINSYVDELARRGLLKGFFVSVRPYSRDQICAAIRGLEKEVQAGSVQLSPHESWLLGRLKDEFGLLLGEASTFIPAAEIGAELEVIGSSAETEITWKDDVGGEETEETVTESEESLRAVGSGWVEVSMTHGLSLSHRFRVDSNVEEDPGFLGRPWRDDVGGYVANGYGRLRLGPLDAVLGRDKLSWGPGASGSLVLSDVAPAFDMVSVSFNLGRVRAAGFFTRLDDLELRRAIFYAGDSLQSGDLIERYLSGHRIDIRVTPTLQIGLSETIVYGGPDRDFELGYVNPLNFFYSHQWNVGENDNPIWCLDACWWPVPRVQVYGQFLVDDYQFEHEGEKDEEPPEIGFLLGVHSGEPLGLEGVSVSAEYARVNPWTYNQPLPWNRYTHGGALLGHPLGPDADAFYVRVDKWFRKDISARLDYRFMRHGETSVESDWPVPIAGPWGEASFPEGFPLGVAAKSHRLGLTAGFYPMLHLDVEGFAYVESVSDYANQAGAKSVELELGLKVNFRPEWVLGMGNQ